MFASLCKGEGAVFYHTILEDEYNFCIGNSLFLPAVHGKDALCHTVEPFLGNARLSDIHHRPQLPYRRKNAAFLKKQSEMAPSAKIRRGVRLGALSQGYLSLL